jgi:signal transduction histidine kinase
LEKQILTNWAQLAHDMQTNLSTIRLNTETINSDAEEDIERKKKILHQVSILVHRIRDIVTVGRDDKLELISVNSLDFCNEIYAEFDSNIFSAVQFKLDIRNFNFICDKPKLLRAVRNAIENSIKYMKEKGGTITIGADKDIHNIVISVKDTGKGMDEKTKEKIFTPYFSTARREGGYGIGSIIMQRVVELHGGKIIVVSEKGIGTEIKFVLPDISRKQIKN